MQALSVDFLQVCSVKQQAAGGFSLVFNWFQLDFIRFYSISSTFSINFLRKTADFTGFIIDLHLWQVQFLLVYTGFILHLYWFIQDFLLWPQAICRCILIFSQFLCKVYFHCKKNKFNFYKFCVYGTSQCVGAEAHSIFNFNLKTKIIQAKQALWAVVRFGPRPMAAGQVWPYVWSRRLVEKPHQLSDVKAIQVAVLVRILLLWATCGPQ